NILRLEETLAERLGLTESQPHVDQLMVPIHHSPDQVVVDTEGTSNVISATADTTTALSTTLASASTVVPIFVDDYEVAGTDDRAGADGTADPFPNVDDAELNIPLATMMSNDVNFIPESCTMNDGMSLAVDSSEINDSSSTTSRIDASSLLSSKRTRLISKASLFCSRSTFTVLSVGMPISAEVTASFPYVNENEMSPLLDFIIVRVPSSRYLKIGAIQVSPSSSTTANISNAIMDFSFNSSTNTCLLKCVKLVEAILLNSGSCQHPLQHTFRSLDWLQNANPHLPR
nr:hypothetical protein [Tanacetum cinerariifolium]